MTKRHLSRVIWAALASGLLLAGCAQPASGHLPSVHGGTPNSGTTQSSSAATVIEQFDSCMKAHGVLVPPGLNPLDKTQTSKLSPTALAACAGILQRLLQVEHPLGVQQELARSLKFAVCMRKQGIPTYDPKLGAGGQVSIQYGPGVSVTDPKFQHALQTCSAERG